MKKSIVFSLLAVAVTAAATAYAEEQKPLILGHPDRPCADDPHCFNRIHPDIPMAATASAGQQVVLKTRNAFDVDLAAHSRGEVSTFEFGAVHPLTGPVHFDGAEPGDTLAVTIHAIEPGKVGLTRMSRFGFAADYLDETLDVTWELGKDSARSAQLAGVVIPEASFPGVITTLAGPAEVTRMLRRETALAEAGGDVYGPYPDFAVPAEVCGEGSPQAAQCLRTIPPREHGGNMDIRYLREGVTIFLPCYVAGCGLGIGDMHYAQGDGEVAGTAIEMDGDVTLTGRVIKGGMKNYAGPTYQGPSAVLDIPSRSFYATTGIPVKSGGTVPPEMAYLESAKAAGLENLSRDINLAARNALDQMIDYISQSYGFSRPEAHIIASVAVDLRIGQLVDTPNVNVTAILPLDIFENGPEPKTQASEEDR